MRKVRPLLLGLLLVVAGCSPVPRNEALKQLRTDHPGAAKIQFVGNHSSMDFYVIVDSNYTIHNYKSYQGTIVLDDEK